MWVAKRARVGDTSHLIRERGAEERMIEATCHCGAVRLQIARAPDEVADCNCSLCRRLGAVWAYCPPAQVEVLSAPEATVAYIQGDRTLATHHCRVCGCTTHWAPLDPTVDRMGVNARLMDPKALAATPVKKFDGADTWT